MDPDLAKKRGLTTAKDNGRFELTDLNMQSVDNTVQCRICLSGLSGVDHEMTLEQS